MTITGTIMTLITIRKRVPLFLFILLSGFLGYVFLINQTFFSKSCDYQDWSNEIFSEELWTSDNKLNRYKYVYDLLNKDIIGLKYVEIAKLLGDPDYKEPNLSYIYYNIAVPISIREECNLYDAIALKLVFSSEILTGSEVIYD